MTKLVTRTDPQEKILAQFHVELRPFLDGDYQVSSSFKAILQEQIDSNQQLINQTKPTKKKDNQKVESPKRTSSSKSKGQILSSFSPIYFYFI